MKAAKKNNKLQQESKHTMEELQNSREFKKDVKELQDYLHAVVLRPQDFCSFCGVVDFAQKDAVDTGVACFLCDRKYCEMDVADNMNVCCHCKKLICYHCWDEYEHALADKVQCYDVEKCTQTSNVT